MKRLILTVAAAILVVALMGCDSGDGRLGDLASQVTHEQAEQNRRMVDASRAVADGSKGLVEADANARRDAIKLQQDLRQDQAEIGRQRDALESERRTIAQERRTDSVLGSGLLILGLILACLCPLILAGIALLGLWREPTKEEEGQILVEELAHTFLSDSGSSVPAVGQVVELPALPPSSASGEAEI